MNSLATTAAHTRHLPHEFWIIFGIVYLVVGVATIVIGCCNDSLNDGELIALGVTWPISLVIGIIWCVKTTLRIGKEAIIGKEN